MQSFALELYQQYLNGKSVVQLATELGIPIERIAQRIRVAAAYTSTHRVSLQSHAR
jgi:hypothetical protein